MPLNFVYMCACVCEAVPVCVYMCVQVLGILMNYKMFSPKHQTPKKY